MEALKNMYKHMAQAKKMVAIENVRIQTLLRMVKSWRN
jgi:hypothetical protein